MSTSRVGSNDSIKDFACYDDLAMKNPLFADVVKTREEFKETLRAGNGAISFVARREALKILSKGIDTSDAFAYVNRTMDDFAPSYIDVITDEQKATVQKVTSKFYTAVQNLFKSNNGKALFDQHAAYKVAYKERIKELAIYHFKHPEKKEEVEAVNSNPPRTLTPADFNNCVVIAIEAIPVVDSVKKEVTPLIEPLNLNEETRNYVGDYTIRRVAKKVHCDNALGFLLKPTRIDERIMYFLIYTTKLFDRI